MQIIERKNSKKKKGRRKKYRRKLILPQSVKRWTQDGALSLPEIGFYQREFHWRKPGASMWGRRVKCVKISLLSSSESI